MIPIMNRRAALAAAALLLIGAGGGQAQGEREGERFGVPVFPGARAQPSVARAVEVYYRQAIQPGQTLQAGVFVTDADLEQVAEFYGPRMDPGKWGWRRKAVPLVPFTRSLHLLRASVEEQPGGGAVPEILRPLLGAPSAKDFERDLERLGKRHPDAVIRMVEGHRSLGAGPDGGELRIVVERPYLDLERGRLVDRTRIQMVRVADRQESR